MKKSYYCERLNKTIVFDALKVFFCCATRTGPCVDFSSTNGNVTVNDIKTILNRRKKLIQDLSSGNLPAECVGCFDLKEYAKKKSFLEVLFSQPQKPSTMVIKHYRQCDCSCVYCSEQNLSKRKIVLKSKKSDYYDLLPILKELYSKDLLDSKNLEVLIQGGNSAVLDECDDIIRLLVENKCKKIEMAINAIQYQPIIEEVCKKTFVDLDISIDCGSREMFKKIKTVDKFDDVVSNIKRYVKLPIQVRLKYILVRGVNDNIEEVAKYIQLMKEIGIKISELTIDQCDPDFDNGKDFVIPEHWYKIYDFWEKECYKNGIYPSLWEYLREILKKGSFFK